MKLDATKSKAYGGGTGSILSLLATEAVIDKIIVILTWLLSFVGSPPEEVAQALAFICQAVISFGVGYAITYYAPPNRMEGVLLKSEMKTEGETTTLTDRSGMDR